MKHILVCMLALALIFSSFLLPSCKNEPEESTSTSIFLVQDGQPIYKVVRSDTVSSDSPEKTAAASLRRALINATGAEVEAATDWIGWNEDAEVYKTVKEILVGHTNRDETAEAISDLEFNEFVIKVSGDKLVICGADEAVTQRAVDYFISTYIKDGSTSVELPFDLTLTLPADFSNSTTHGTTYLSMAETAFKAFTRYYYGGGSLPGAHFWDTAEILETFLDAYEQTGDDKYLTYINGVTSNVGTNTRTSWASNEYNDDIAWMCIAYARIFLLTGESDYLTIAQKNFDTMYNRAISDDLGGGLFWRTDNQTKNSCINCPASIAACLIGKATNDDSYYEKAKALMDWEFQNMFASTGAVYDAYNLSGEISKWASSYNQGTFIGACTLLHEKYNDEIYLTNAKKAADYAMSNLPNKNGVLTDEDSSDDLIGFKGILTRWIYRYAKYTNRIDILGWLQMNADTAYSNRNSKNLIWTTWASPTSDSTTNMDIYGFSTAIALLYNCEPWW